MTLKDLIEAYLDHGRDRMARDRPPTTLNGFLTQIKLPDDFRFAHYHELECELMCQAEEGRVVEVRTALGYLGYVRRRDYLRYERRCVLRLVAPPLEPPLPPAA